MKPLLAALLFIVAIKGFAQCPTQPPTPDGSVKAETCTVQGTVVAVATGAPVKSAWVALTAVDECGFAVTTEDGIFQGITDAHGHFVIAGVSAGRYQFRAGKTGYLPGDYCLGGRPPKARLVLHPGEKLDTVEFRLSRTSLILGRVTDETGEPIAGVEMDAFVTGTHMGDYVLMDPSRIVVTNDLGEYRINDLPPGSYYLSAIDSGSSVYGTSTEFIWQQRARYANHLTMFYPDVTKSSEAQKIRLMAGQEKRIDFTLRTVKLLTLSGRLLGADGKPPAQTKVKLRPQDPYSAPLRDFRLGVTTDAKGNFVIREVLPGSYVVSATVGEEEYWTEQRVEVARDNVSGLVLILKKELTLSGKLKAVGRPKLDFQDVHVWLESPTPDERSYHAWADAQKNGTFTIPKVRHTTLRLNLYPVPDGWYLRSAFFGKQNVLEDGLDLSASDSHESLKLTFSHAAGRIEGVVFRGNDPAYGALVRIFPEPANLNNTGLYGEREAGEDGHFVMDSVVPGRYRVVAYASERTDGDGGSPYDDSVSASVVVSEKESKTLNLMLPRREE
ncbi:MAG: carboxypeptidase regulatory-like domain-containing protein [Terriglobia bacterium]